MEAAVRLRENFGLINFNFWGKSGRCPSTWMNWTRLQVEDQVVSLCVRRRMIEYNRRTLWWTEKIWSCTTQRTCCCGHCYRRRTYICLIPLWLSLEFNCWGVETAGDFEMMELENKTNWFLKKEKLNKLVSKSSYLWLCCRSQKEKRKKKKNNQKSSGEEFTRIKNQWCVWRKSVVETQW